MGSDMHWGGDLGMHSDCDLDNLDNSDVSSDMSPNSFDMNISGRNFQN